jgi:hypothetical protein
MRDRNARVRKVERRETPAKPARMGKGIRSDSAFGADAARGREPRLAKVLEEWLAEARIRYTHAGD